MIDPAAQDDTGLPLPARAVSCVWLLGHASSGLQVFVLGPDRKVKLSILYPATTGRNFEFASHARSLRPTGLQRGPARARLAAADPVPQGVPHGRCRGRLTAQVATPVNWKHGEPCMVVSSVKAEDLAATFPKGVEVKAVPSGKAYIRVTPQPNI